jgi:AcrR family transcriptional regulator
MNRRNKTEKRIVRGAIELFARKGYHGTSVHEITQKAKLTKGSLYSHFNGKGELLLRIIEEYENRYIGPMIRAVEECSGDAIEKLHRAISYSSKFAVKNLDLCVFLSFLTAELKADVDFQPALRRVYLKYQKFISGLIELGKRQGLIKRELDPDLAALVFMATHEGVLHQWVLNRDYVDGTQYVRTFRAMLMEGLKS